MNSRKHALQIFRAALAAADPQDAVVRHLKFDGWTIAAGRIKYPLKKFDRIQVIGAGKASASMARPEDWSDWRRRFEAPAASWIKSRHGRLTRPLEA